MHSSHLTNEAKYVQVVLVSSFGWLGGGPPLRLTIYKKKTLHANTPFLHRWPKK
jgi:hypothetical protein